MLMIRLKRVGRKHDPSYRIVVTEKQRGPKSGRYVENVGSYDARSNKREINAERVRYWIDNGATPSPTVHNLLVSEKVIEGKKVNVLPQKSPVKGEETEAAAPVETVAATPASEEAQPTEVPETTDESTKSAAEPAPAEVAPATPVAEEETPTEPTEKTPAEEISTPETTEGPAEAATE
jgi:small subunit ribosomal protein S16